jgi:hypothetical protein
MTCFQVQTSAAGSGHLDRGDMVEMTCDPTAVKLFPEPPKS